MAKDDNLLKVLLRVNSEGDASECLIFDVLSNCKNKTDLIKNALFNYIVNIQNVRDIAALTHFSTSYIHQTFKKHLNITPHQYVLMKKMSLAKEFLAKGETVSEACFNAGFDNYAYFITCFKKIFGVTPGKHKKSTD